MWKPRSASLVLLVAAFSGAYLAYKYPPHIANGLGWLLAWCTIIAATLFSFVGGLGGTVVSFGTELDSEGHLKLRDNSLGNELIQHLTPGQNYCETSLQLGAVLTFIGVALMLVCACVSALGYLAWMHPQDAAVFIALTCVIVGAGKLIANGGAGRAFVLGTTACAMIGTALWGATFVDWGPGLTQGKQVLIQDVVPVALALIGLIAAGLLFHHFKGTEVYAGFCPTAPPKEKSDIEHSQGTGQQ